MLRLPLRVDSSWRGATFDVIGLTSIVQQHFEGFYVVEAVGQGPCIVSEFQQTVFWTVDEGIRKRLSVLKLNYAEIKSFKILNHEMKYVTCVEI